MAKRGADDTLFIECSKNKAFALSFLDGILLCAGYIRRHIRKSTNPIDIGNVLHPMILVDICSIECYDKPDADNFGSNLMHQSLGSAILLKIRMTNGKQCKPNHTRLFSLYFQKNECKARYRPDRLYICFTVIGIPKKSDDININQNESPSFEHFLQKYHGMDRYGSIRHIDDNNLQTVMTDFYSVNETIGSKCQFWQLHIRHISISSVPKWGGTHPTYKIWLQKGFIPYIFDHRNKNGTQNRNEYQVARKVLYDDSNTRNINSHEVLFFDQNNVIQVWLDNESKCIYLMKIKINNDHDINGKVEIIGKTFGQGGKNFFWYKKGGMIQLDWENFDYYVGFESAHCCCPNTRGFRFGFKL